MESLGFCDIGSSPGDLQAPKPGLSLGRPPPSPPRREQFLSLPRPIRKWGVPGGPPTSADGDSGHARAPRIQKR